MKSMKGYLIFVLFLITLSACTPDPRKEAQAFEIREQAEQDALNQGQNREHAEELHDLQVEQLQVEQGHREATAAKWREALNTGIGIVKWFAIIGLCYAILSAAHAFSVGSRGWAEAFVRAAEVKANLIALDPTTRQFPVLIQRLGGGRYAAFNPNINSVLLLDIRNEPDRLMIQAMGAVQYVGALASESKQANDPSGVSIINTPLIDIGGRDG